MFSHKSLIIGFAAASLGTLAVAPSAFAGLSLQVTVGSNSQTYAFTDLSAALGSGTYGTTGASLGGFTWNGILLTGVGTDQLTSSLSTIKNGNTGPGNEAITFDVSESGLADPSAASTQSSGGATSTSATFAQTVDFYSSVIPTTGGTTAIDSGAMGLNSAISPTSPSSSVSFSSAGVNLGSVTGPFTLHNQLTFNIDPGTTIKTSNLTNTLSNSTVAVPEPRSVTLMALSAFSLLLLRRRARI